MWRHAPWQKAVARGVLALLAAAALQGCNSGASTRQSEPPAATPPPPAPPATPGPTGLDTRPANASCLAWARPGIDSAISLERYTALTFNLPVALLQAPRDDSRWFVVQQGGRVLTFAVASPVARDFIDITARVRSGGETGLLGMAFHPDFPQDPRVFLSYTSGTPLVSRISAFRTLDSGATLDPASEQVLLSVTQPEENHNGGHIAFGPDGYLYIGLGDGGGAGDRHGEQGNGQRLTTLLGKLLRIDVDAAAPYGIVGANPFSANARCPPGGRASGECPEIYAWGLRNPWRFSFDRASGELWLADVGQNRWEEVNRVALGGNYGWRCREGAHDFNESGTPGCDRGGLSEPVAEYDHSLGNSVTGGYVYRGTQTTSLRGRYLFGDFVSGRIWAWLAENAATPRQPTQLLDTALNISSFAEGNDGELYVVDYGGTLQHIVFQAGSGTDAVPGTLGATGCVSASNPAQPAAGLIPYTVNAAFWSDGADKERWMALPDGQTISVQAGGDWEFPAGTVLMKHFRLGTRLIETRLLLRHPDGNWGGFTYEWNAAQSAATLLPGGAVRDLGNGQQWIFPSEAQCLECHTAAAGRSLGLETAQLNRDFNYSQTGRNANQLATLDHIAVLTPPAGAAAALPAMPDPAEDASASAENRARAYLHTNCSQCHRPGGPTPSAMDLRYATALGATNTCNVLPQAGDLGLGSSARLIAPGAAANSLIVNRMNRRDAHAMPPLGSNQVDTAGVALLSGWIDSLAGC